MRVIVLGAISLVAGMANAGETNAKAMDDFRLQDYRGAWYSLKDVPKDHFVVVAFLGTECPLAKLYSPRLNQLANEYQPKGVQFFAINSNRQDSISDIEHYAKKQEIEYPILKDVGNVVADQFGAQRTPEIYVLDRDRVVVFHGRVDDQYGVGYLRPEATRHDLKEALEELLAGKSVSVAQTATPGCLIGRLRSTDSGSDVTYSKQIARIFQGRCVECHRSGQIAPFSLTSYEEAAGWADTIVEVVRDQRMPPWHASPEHGDFVNDAKLTSEEKELLYAWAEAGAPEGNASDLPEPRAFAEGWRIPEPDLVMEMSEDYDVPATGEVPYQYFVLDPKLTEDKWISAAECIAGNPQVVHHNIAFIVPPDIAKDMKEGHFASQGGRERFGRLARDEDRRGPSGEGLSGGAVKQANLPGGLTQRIGIMRSWFTNYLVAMAPGTPPMILTDGKAKRIQAGSKIVFQMHYTPVGTPQKDRSKIGLVFADASKIKREVVTRSVLEQRFEIPPHDPNHEVRGSVRFRDDTYLLELFPHMHLRGKDFKYTAIYPDGTSEVLLDVPRYDFAWQNIYTFREPKLMPRGTVLDCVAHFDNSESNLSNPDPSATVRFGDQTWEEMMIGFFNMALVREGVYFDPDKSRTEQFVERQKAGELLVTSELRERAAKALDSEADFDRFWDMVVARYPQIDRMDVGVADGLSFRWAFVAQGLEIPSTMKMKELPRQMNAVGPALGLYQYAIKKETTVNLDPGAAKGMEMRFLGRILPSSVHIPIRTQGKPAAVNFWSAEDNAFPPEAVASLEELVDLMKSATERVTARK